MQAEECWIKFEEKRRKLTRLFFLVLCFNVVLHLDGVKEIIDGPTPLANTFVKAERACSSLTTVKTSNNSSELATHLFLTIATIIQYDLSKLGFHSYNKTQYLVFVKPKYNTHKPLKMKRFNPFHFSGLSPPQFA